MGLIYNEYLLVHENIGRSVHTRTSQQIIVCPEALKAPGWLNLGLSISQISLDLDFILIDSYFYLLLPIMITTRSCWRALTPSLYWILMSITHRNTVSKLSCGSFSDIFCDLLIPVKNSFYACKVNYFFMFLFNYFTFNKHSTDKKQS